MDDMDTASGLVFHLAHRTGRPGLALLALALVLMSATFISVVVVADLLAPASEPIMSAPFRWVSHRS